MRCCEHPILTAQPPMAGYARAVAVFAACAVSELAVEPLWLLTQICMMPRLKVRWPRACLTPKVVVDSAALLARCLAVVASVQLFPGLGGFCLAQAMQSIVMVTLFYEFMRRRTLEGFHMHVLLE